VDWHVLTISGSEAIENKKYYIYKNYHLMKTTGTLLILAMFLGFIPDSFASVTLQSSIISTIDPPDDTYYYEYSEVLFGTGVDQEGNMIDEASEFALPSKGPIEIAVGTFQDDPFLTSKVYVEIYDEENEMVDEFYIEIDTEWNWFKFMVEFDKAGTYYIDLYNEIDVFINSGTVTITD
jgi:hypothetical protein